MNSWKTDISKLITFAQLVGMLNPRELNLGKRKLVHLHLVLVLPLVFHKNRRWIQCLQAFRRAALWKCPETIPVLFQLSDSILILFQRESKRLFHFIVFHDNIMQLLLRQKVLETTHHVIFVAENFKPVLEVIWVWHQNFLAFSLSPFKLSMLVLFQGVARVEVGRHVITTWVQGKSQRLFLLHIPVLLNVGKLPILKLNFLF